MSDDLRKALIETHLAIEAQRGEVFFKAADPARRNYAVQMLDELETEFRAIALKYGVKLMEPGE